VAITTDSNTIVAGATDLGSTGAVVVWTYNSGTSTYDLHPSSPLTYAGTSATSFAAIGLCVSDDGTIWAGDMGSQTVVAFALSGTSYSYSASLSVGAVTGATPEFPTLIRVTPDGTVLVVSDDAYGT